jgi:hypothetical protein
LNPPVPMLSDVTVHTQERRDLTHRIMDLMSIGLLRFGLSQSPGRTSPERYAMTLRHRDDLLVRLEG